jgi:hypothetical protein
MEQEIKDPIDFLNLLSRNDYTNVKFMKKDGTERIMKCTLNFKNIPNEYKPKKVDVPKILNLLRKNKIVRVFDIEFYGWRSVSFDRTIWIETPNQKRYQIKKK